VSFHPKLGVREIAPKLKSKCHDPIKAPQGKPQAKEKMNPGPTNGLMVLLGCLIT